LNSLASGTQARFKTRTRDIHQSIQAALAICQNEIEEKKLGLVVKLVARRHHVRETPLGSSSFSGI
jgi:hypothetical protein